MLAELVIIDICSDQVSRLSVVLPGKFSKWDLFLLPVAVRNVGCLEEKQGECACMS